MIKDVIKAPAFAENSGGGGDSRDESDILRLVSLEGRTHSASLGLLMY